MNCTLMYTENCGKNYIVLKEHNLNMNRYVFTKDLEFVHGFSNKIGPECNEYYDIIDFHKDYTDEEFNEIFQKLKNKVETLSTLFQYG